MVTEAVRRIPFCALTLALTLRVQDVLKRAQTELGCPTHVAIVTGDMREREREEKREREREKERKKERKRCSKTTVWTGPIAVHVS